MTSRPALRLDSSEVRSAWAKASARFPTYRREVRNSPASTCMAYRSDFCQFERLLAEHQQITDTHCVTRVHVEGFLQSDPAWSPATKRRKPDATSALFQYLIHRGRADRHPTEGIGRPRKPDEEPSRSRPAFSNGSSSEGS